jgi:opacity protein-like surface antigen
MKPLMMICCCLLLGALAATANADDSYLALKGGGFLPNSKGSGGQGGLKDFDTGYNLEVAIGFRPASYAAIELGSGFYTTRRDTNAPTGNEKISAYGVPVTATAKGVLTTGPVDIFAGAGFGYYFTLFDREIPNKKESMHSNALGYHLVGGVDYRLNEHYSLGTEIKWFSVKPEFDDFNTAGAKVKWDFGGTIFNIGMKYSF